MSRMVEGTQVIDRSWLLPSSQLEYKMLMEPSKEHDMAFVRVIVSTHYRGQNGGI